ncbi:CCA tRNA nucleotidyltransferase [Caproiciproducens sp.]|uniref:CCA tRNA nucleotidyltransferase n=1 Tax=Caproiciproducens sp. TaxID=1954376 RepID=UPI00289BED25|nr:tRNA nucleotidyltransferase [Caproiciproducens sp.]
MQIHIPPQVEAVLQKLDVSGHEAYVVGGCVRDTILGMEPNDWDVTTSALPNEIELALNGYQCIKTGIQHGTLTVLTDYMPVEVTSYRIDGRYSDNRHPDSVRFTNSLKEDLSRRDFTVNALAYNHAEGIIDCFGGIEDLKNRTIRCVGVPDLRFQEDGLRILRALRFSAVLDFTIEQGTSSGILKNCALLRNIARERINSEFTKLLCGNAEGILRKYRPVFEQFIPEIRFITDAGVWEHTMSTVTAVKADPVLRLTMLLRSQSAETAGEILRRLRYDSGMINTVVRLVELQQLPLPANEKALLRLLNQYGEKTLRCLFKMKAADRKAQDPAVTGEPEKLKAAEAMLENVLTRGLCFSLKDLQLKGSDLLSLGIPQGAEIGRLLSFLLDAVMDGKCPNQHDSLIKYVRSIKDKYHD